MMMVVETLKCKGQCPNSMHALTMLINFLKHVMSLTYFLRCFHDNLSGSGIDKLFHLAIALVNFSSEKGLYFVTGLFAIS